MRDPQLVLIEFQVAQLSKRIMYNSGKSYERYAQRFSSEIYYESKRRNSVERELLIDTATKHGFDESLIQIDQPETTCLFHPKQHGERDCSLTIQ